MNKFRVDFILLIIVLFWFVVPVGAADDTDGDNDISSHIYSVCLESKKFAVIVDRNGLAITQIFNKAFSCIV